MERHFDEQLHTLKGRLITMGSLAEQMIGTAVKVLVEGSTALVASVTEHEREVNDLQIEVDETCLMLIATHQPVAADLRFLVGAIKTNAELERLADQAVNICDKAAELAASDARLTFSIIPRMAELASAMVKDSIHAYVGRDVGLARRVLMRDDEVDSLKREVTERMTGYIRSHPELLEASLAVILVARNLERIGDHATNIAENTIFVVEGKDVRHHAEDIDRT